MAELTNIDAIIQISRANGRVWDPGAGTVVPQYMLIYVVAENVIKQGDGVNYIGDLDVLFNFNSVADIKSFYDTYFNKLIDQTDPAGKIIIADGENDVITFTELLISDFVDSDSFTSTLAEYSDVGHTHPTDDIDDAGTVITRNIGIEQNNVVPISSTGKLPINVFNPNSALSPDDSDIVSYLLLSRLSKDDEIAMSLDNSFSDEFVNFDMVDDGLSRDYIQGDESFSLAAIRTQHDIEAISISGDTVALRYHSVCIIDNVIYAFGGIDISGDYQNSLYSIDIDSGVVTNLGTYGVVRAYHKAVAYDGKMYIYAGHSTDTGVLNDLQQYDPITNTWTALSTNYTTHGHTMCILNGIIYIAGGANSGKLTNFVSYNIDTDTWTTLSNLVEENSAAAMSVSNNDVLLLAGGVTDAGDTVTAYMYNISTNSWIQIADAPYGGNTPHTFNANSCVYIWNASGGFCRLLPDNTWETLSVSSFLSNMIIPVVSDNYVYGYGRTGDQCSLYKIKLYDTDITSFPKNPMSYMSTLNSVFVGIGDKIYAFGGFGVNTDNLSTFMMYNISTSTWVQLTSGPSARQGAAAVVVGTDIYIHGGYDFPTSYTDLWKYDTLTDTWTELGDAPLSGRRLHSLCNIGDKLYLYGGTDLSFTFSELWEYDISGDAWVQLPDGVYPMYAHAVGVYDSDIYALYGNRFYKYEPLIDTWTRLTDAPYSPAYASNLVVYNNEIYAIGENVLFAYNPITDSWSTSRTNIGYFSNSKGYVYNDNLYIYSTERTGENIVIDLADMLNNEYAVSTTIVGNTVQPETGRMFVRADIGDLAMLNVDIITYVSRDDGANWSPIVLEKLPMIDGTIACYGGDINFSLQEFTETSQHTNATIEDVKGNITGFIVDTADISGHFNNPTNERIIPGCIIELSDGTELTITGITDAGNLTNYITFDGTVATGTYVISSIRGIDTGGNLSLNLTGELDVYYNRLTANGVERTAHSAATVDDKVYIFGGYNDSTYLNDFWKYDPINDTWEELATGPTARRHHTTITVDYKIYLFGGYSPVDGELNDLWKYNTVTDTWTQLNDSPIYRFRHAAAVIGNKMYISEGSSDTVGYLDDMWVYDISEDTWTQLASCPVVRIQHTASVIDNKIYIYGGYDGSNYLDDLWVYDPSLDTWTQLASCTEALFEASASVIAGKIYIFGGLFETTYFEDLYEYNPVTNTWTQHVSDGIARYQHTASVIDNKIYICSGYDGSNYLDDIRSITISNKTITHREDYSIKSPWGYYDTLPDSYASCNSNLMYDGKIYMLPGAQSDGVQYQYPISFYSYDITTGVSATLTDSPGNFYFGAAGFIGGKLYATGGTLRYSGGDTNMYKYDPTIDTWSIVADLSTLPIYYQVGACIIDNKMYIMGHGTNNLWCFDPSDNSLTQLANFSETVYSPSLAKYDGKLYLCGYKTTSDNASVSAGFYEYDPSTDTWTQLADRLTPAFVNPCIVISNKLYTFGGHNGTTGITDCHAYDLDIGFWEVLPDIRTEHTTGCACQYGGHAYVFNGYNVANGGLHQGKNSTIDKLNISDIPYKIIYSSSDAYPGKINNQDTVEYNDYLYSFTGDAMYKHDIVNDTWEKFPTNVTPRVGAGFVSDGNGKLYILGGHDYVNDVRLNDTWEYDIATDTWTPLAVLSGNISHAVSFYNNGKIYVVGGYNEGVGYSAENRIYDIVSDSWSYGTSVSTAVSHTSGVVYNNKLYIYSGYISGSTSDTILRIYDISGDSWSYITNNTPSSRYGHNCIIFGDKIYMVGGRDYTTLNTIGEMWRYDITNDIWVQLTDAPSVMQYHQIVRYGDSIHIIGGLDDNNISPYQHTHFVYDITLDNWSIYGKGPVGRSQAQMVKGDGNYIYLYGGWNWELSLQLRDLWRYDTVADTWERLLDGDVGARLSATEYYNSTNGPRIYVIGGLRNIDLTTNTCGDVVLYYDITTGTWGNSAVSYTGTCGHATVQLGGKIYVTGGITSDSIYLSNTRVYDIENDTWTELSPMPNAKQRHSASVLNNKIYVYGGKDGSITFDDLYVYDIDLDTWTTLYPENTVAMMYHKSFAFDNKVFFYGGNYGYDVYVYDIIKHRFYRVGSSPRGLQHTELAFDSENVAIYALGTATINDAIVSPMWKYQFSSVYEPTHFTTTFDITHENFNKVFATRTTQNNGDGKIAYSFVYNDNTVDIWYNDSWTTIVQYNNSKWQYYVVAEDTWIESSLNNMETAISEAYEMNNYDYMEDYEIIELSGIRDGKEMTAMAATLTTQGNSPTLSSVTVSGVSDLLEAAPAGTDIRWKIVSNGTDESIIHGIRIKWAGDQ